MIHWISSQEHPRLEPYRHVGDPGWLRHQNLFVAEGRLIVQRLLDLDRFDVTSILVNQAAHDAMLERLAATEANVYVCDDALIANLTGYNFHRGCLAIVRRPTPASLECAAGGSMVLALEGVSNPDNVGGLFRTAAAFGVGGLVLNSTAGDPYYRKALRTSMGAVLRMPFARLADWTAGLASLKAAGFTIVALTPRADAIPIAEFAAETPQGKLALLVGAEGTGLSPASLAFADARVRIPIDSTIDSLNVVVAAGIALERCAGRLALGARPVHEAH